MTARVRITHPRTTAARSVPVRPPAREIDELTALGELYLASLMRSQRRAAFAGCAGTIGLLLAVAVATAEFSSWGHVTVLGIALPWILVGIAVYPVLGGIGFLAVRLAERNERAFAALMHQR
ncbi:hypothetical protein SAMN05661080_00472 [Modestobacter sp. DSM 44400]|uniref:hypothetical protein n=1 Tax=Modestobacter sp. DSM 44400 TaxID=1550230 RepID=UPI00089C6533|nr:hypothetical protein [Modestobacter sp. DSM 44400]SDX58785.1 hypothetical protein SAMN05661080_00472 [Modestobacter sp. DSM 44400]